MPSITISAGSPPQSQVLATAPGTLTRVRADSPNISPVGAAASQVLFDASLPRRNGDMNCSFFDGLTLATATPLVSYGGTADSGPVSIPFAVGLIVVSRAPSSFVASFTLN